MYNDILKEENLRFKGILKDRNIEKLTKDVFEVFIFNKILVETTPISQLRINTGKELNSTELHKYFFWNGKDYALNDVILEEIYQILKFHVEFSMSDVNWEIKPIINKLNSFLDRNEKIDFLKRHYRKAYDTSSSFALYLGYEDNGCPDWKNWIFEYIGMSPELLNLYLTTKNETFMNEVIDHRSLFEKIDDDIFSLLDDWSNHYELKGKLDFISVSLNNLGYSEKPVLPKKNTYTLREKIYLLDSIVSDKNWYDHNPSEMSRVVQLLFEGTERNIRKFIATLDKKPSQRSVQESKIISKMKMLYNSTLIKT